MAKVHVAGGFDANGAIQLIYVGKTANPARRTADHYAKTLDGNVAGQETTLLNATAKACSSFFILPAVGFTGDNWLQAQATAEGLLCLLFGSCQLYKAVFSCLPSREAQSLSTIVSKKSKLLSKRPRREHGPIGSSSQTPMMKTMTSLLAHQYKRQLRRRV